MNEPVFEVRRTDAAGRLGRLELPRSGVSVETPALLPVVNPNVQNISPARLADDFGAEMLITNAYVLHQSEELRTAALADGVHELLGFSGGVMTDSGSFQLAEYGRIDVDSEEILRFQDDIGSDVATPVDVPTPPDADRERAVADLEATGDAIAAAAAYEAGDMLRSAPVQGGRFPDLRETAAAHAYAAGLDVYPIGALVPLLRGYRFDEVVEVVVAAQRGLGRDVPVHLFGAGHPMMFALGVALGGDLFDSAAYALYAREGRYLTVTGTKHLAELSTFPCHCPVCTATTPAALEAADRDRRHRRLAEHNLHVTFGEIRRVREAIRQGELLELVEARARAHPRLLDGYRAALEAVEFLEATEPATAPRPYFYLSAESADRPEVERHHRRLSRLDVPDPLVLVDPGIAANLPGEDPWRGGDLPLPDAVTGLDPETPRWYALPPFGPVPPALLETYPLTAELPERRDDAGAVRAADGIAALVGAHDVSVTLVHAGWPGHALDRLPEGIRTVAHGAVGGEDSSGPAADPAA